MIRLKDVNWAIGRLDTNVAGGLDGWRPADMKLIPNPILNLLVTMYNKIEDLGKWPTELCSAGVSLIPEGQGGGGERGAPLDQRPIMLSAITGYGPPSGCGTPFRGKSSGCVRASTVPARNARP